MSTLAKHIILAGLILVTLGLALGLVSKFVKLGHLPGDIVIKRPNMTLYIPITSCIVISVLLTVIFHLWKTR